MTLDEFWDLISECRPNRKFDESFPEEFLRNCEKKLDRLPPDELCSYANHFSDMYDTAYRAELRDVQVILTRLPGADSFDYFVPWLIAQGRDAFESVLNNPESIDQYLEDDANYPAFEEFLCFPIGEIYQSKAGQPFPLDLPIAALVGTLSKSEQELAERYPTLWKKYGDSPL